MSANPNNSLPKHDSDCRDRLIEAAHQEFCRDGFPGASVDRIAAAAGVAKQTLYNHFPSKEALFEESIRSGVSKVVVELDATIPGSFRERLIAFSIALRAKLLSPEALTWHRTLVAELSRLPELGRIVWRQGPVETQRRLADFLAEAMKRGELRPDDPMFAAEMLSSMLINFDRTRGLLSGDLDLSEEPQRVERIVNCFLHAYRPS
jgi:TetR/AcrR family transcriptional repressor of mexJK operon